MALKSEKQATITFHFLKIDYLIIDPIIAIQILIYHSSYILKTHSTPLLPQKIKKYRLRFD